MKKIITLLYICLLSNFSIASGAFGTHPRMTEEELKSKGISIQFIYDEVLSAPTFHAPVRNKFIKYYRYGFTEDKKLCSVYGETKLSVNPSEIINQLNVFYKLLTQKYGKPSLIKDIHIQQQGRNMPTELNLANVIEGLLKDNLYLNRLDPERSSQRYIFNWSNVSDGIREIFLYPYAIPLKNTTRDHFMDAPATFFDNNHTYDKVAINKAVLKYAIDSKTQENDYKSAIKLVIEYRFNDCQTVYQSHRVDILNFSDDNQGL